MGLRPQPEQPVILLPARAWARGLRATLIGHCARKLSQATLPSLRPFPWAPHVSRSPRLVHQLGPCPGWAAQATRAHRQGRLHGWQAETSCPSPWGWGLLSPRGQPLAQSCWASTGPRRRRYNVWSPIGPHSFLFPQGAEGPILGLRVQGCAESSHTGLVLPKAVLPTFSRCPLRVAARSRWAGGTGWLLGLVEALWAQWAGGLAPQDEP